MNVSFGRHTAVSALLIASSVYAGAARSECISSEVLSMMPQMQKQSWQENMKPHLTPIDWRRHDDDVVGYWNIVVSSKGNPGIPDGTVLDRGLQHWHDDGTEFLNSSNQHPATQNYCMGVWEQTGPYAYKLNHFAYTYNPDQTVSGLVRIREDIRLSHDGSQMTGTQTVDVYDGLRNHLANVTGQLIGKRITVNTTAQEIQ